MHELGGGGATKRQGQNAAIVSSVISGNYGTGDGEGKKCKGKDRGKRMIEKHLVYRT